MDLFTYDWEDEESVLTAIVEAIETVSGREAAELGVLNSVVDLDALMQLLTSFRDSATPNGSIEFSFDRYRVLVAANGVIAVGTDRGAPSAMVTTENEFETVLARLVRQAADNGVAVEGIWATRWRDGTPGWDVEINRIDRPNRPER